MLFFFSSVVVAETIDVGGAAFSYHPLRVGMGESAAAVADFDGDGQLDIAVSNAGEHNVMIFLGAKKTLTNTYPAGQKPTDIVALDMNQDGHTDLAIANHETSYITLLIGDGQGHFRPAAQSPLMVRVQPHPHQVAVRDVDGDGLVDVMVDDRDRSGVRVFPAKPDGIFDSTGILIGVGGDPYLGFLAAHLNGDQQLDFISPNPNHIGVVLSRPGHAFHYDVTKLDVPVSPFGLALADFNGDSIADLMAVSESTQAVVLTGAGEGLFNHEQPNVIRLAGGAKQVRAGDINGDGIADALISNWPSGVYVVLGGPSSQAPIDIPHVGISNPWSLTIADLNQDMRDDFIVSDGSSDQALIYFSKP